MVINNWILRKIMCNAVSKNSSQGNDLVTAGLRLTDLLQSQWLFSVGNSVLKIIILHHMCGDGYHLHTETRLEWCSKQEVKVVIQFLNAKNEYAAEIHCQLVADVTV